MKRRKFLALTGASVTGGIAGCAGGEAKSSDEGASSSSSGSENSSSTEEKETNTTSNSESSEDSDTQSGDTESETDANSESEIETSSGSGSESEETEKDSTEGSDSGRTGTLEYTGSWSGEATGGVSVGGDMSIKIDYDSGEVSGSIEGDASGPIEGTVSDGKIESKASGRAMNYMTMNMDMTGEVSDNSSSVEGDWSGESNTGMTASGSWSVSKQ